MEQLTGIKMQMVNEKFDPVFRWNGEEHEFSKDFDKRSLYGHFDRVRSMMMFTSNNPISHWDVYLYPLFYSVDSNAKNLAYFATSGYPAVSVKENKDFTSIFYGSKFIKSDVVRAVAKYAGCHIWSDSDDVLFANKNYVAFHASSSGQKTIRFPEKVSVYEVYEKKFYAHDVTELTFDTYLGETKMFRLYKE